MDSIKEFQLVAPRTYRYYEKGDVSKADTLFICLHGFGQLAKYFIRKFNDLDENFFILAPEGMHRSYLNGNSGRVGASWMTKEARESDISDNLLWLNQLLDKVLAEKPFSKIILFGFSQGGATAARWYFNNQSRFDQLILWASVFPHDLEKPAISQKSNNYFIIGKEDEFYSSEQQLAEIEVYQKMGFQTIHFEGKHDVDKEVLKDLLLIK